ncbi:MAG: hypothetical protein ABJO09_09550 [Hyphomicrobiales bacterium]
MTMILPFVVGSHRTVSSLVKSLRQRIREALEKRRIRRNFGDLSQLSDHLLRDLGLEQYAQLRDPEFSHLWLKSHRKD